MWEIVGGVTTGGVMVRVGKDLKSPEAASRLSTGAKVRELALIGDRLNYALEEGTGPAEGWISIKLKDKELARIIDSDDGPKRRVPPWKKVPPAQFEYMEMKERAAKNLPGDYWGIEFPHSRDQIMEMGPKWMTKAFQTTGVMTSDNEVTELSMVEVTGDVSGGAGLKYLLTVKYKKDKPYLHTDLFVKMPHEPKGSDRYYVSVMWGHDRPEAVFNIFLAPSIPFMVPKLYFSDINKDSTNFLLITERVKFASKDRKGTSEFQPGEIEPTYDKMNDYEMPDGGTKYYIAACRNLGKMAAYHKTGRLHPQIDDMFPMPDKIMEVPKVVPGADEATKKLNNAKFDQLIKFVSQMAVTAFPKEMTDPKFLEELKMQVDHIGDYGIEAFCYGSGAGTANPHDWVGLTHNNLQVDNCIYYHDDANELQVGMLDWGVLSCGPLVSAVQGGCISGAQVDIYCEYRDRFAQAFLDSYHEHGGPKLDKDRFVQCMDIQHAMSIGGLKDNVSAILKDVKAAEWATINSVFEDKRVNNLVKWNAKCHSASIHNQILIFKKLDSYKIFQKWIHEQDLPPKKA